MNVTTIKQNRKQTTPRANGAYGKQMYENVYDLTVRSVDASGVDRGEWFTFEVIVVNPCE